MVQILLIQGDHVVEKISRFEESWTKIHRDLLVLFSLEKKEEQGDEKWKQNGRQIEGQLFEC